MNPAQSPFHGGNTGSNPVGSAIAPRRAKVRRMYNPIAWVPARAHIIAVIAAIVMVPVAGSSGAAAQTLTEPSPPPQSSPSPTAKSVTAKHLKACPQYGAGFVQIPGSDACIKVGGYVTIDSGGVRR
jgi:hypothetical protein